ncbi:undecaprenyl/decaprenyl-phosphate alpha-N-acetylglucosaminyl 1-phosphate transferase [Actinospica sp. MGRD01-02]|uniref:Undecaprenyl/decaprenyl-phosphate alpha-N-acetylglucosaminyl 1-phosphate transferase n=1 Tax=Actinospica acidithermotolerans TaxID=2828514 RepID=A0A941IFF1_9ACTN|nr:MraY family glycosyltransferase [Actinospica acidithermotolerans]MBR7824969.1 undecaprenyl/decaprenyl-phosphate alpha-N-acetylglucosaminyl 1-phosphate transferase [Actinospica acidithermotolerans]
MREYLAVLMIAWVVTYLATGPVRDAAFRFGAWTPPRDRDVHTTPTPRLGGVGMYLGFLAAMLAASKLPMMQIRFFQSSQAVPALLIGCTMLIVIGIVDDRWGVDALIKLAGQTLAASIMVLMGVQLTWISIPGVGIISLEPNLAVTLSVFLIVGMINAVNFVDGLDGLAAGMVAIAASCYFVYAYRLQHGYDISSIVPAATVSVILIGMCVGFLCHNWSPARIFMGDSGSMMIGMLLAVITIFAFGLIDPDQLKFVAGSQSTATYKAVPAFLPLVLPFCAVALPVADTVMAVVRRTRAGRSPFSADAEHMHHRLLQIGHSKRRAVLIMYFWSALISFTVVMFSVSSQSRPIVLGAMGFAALGLIGLLLPRVRRHLDDRAGRVRPEKARGRHAAAGETAAERQLAHTGSGLENTRQPRS